MSEAPERIWAWRESPNDSGSWDEAGCRTKFPDDVEYVRADMAPSPEVLAQVREALEKAMPIIHNRQPDKLADAKHLLRAAFAALKGDGQ